MSLFFGISESISLGVHKATSDFAFLICMKLKHGEAGFSLYLVD